MVERVVIDEMLDAYRFERAEELIAQTDPAYVQELRDEIARRRVTAEEEARALYKRIIELGEESRRAELVEVANGSSTEALLGFLPEASRKRAELHLRDAMRWKRRRLEINARRLGEAKRALDGLDLELARGLMNRIDGRFLTEELADERDQLLLDISARRMEVEALEETGRRLMADSKPRPGDRKPPWWRRWLC